MTFNPNVNVAPQLVEKGRRRQRSEMKSCAFVNHRENAVCVSKKERKGAERGLNSRGGERETGSRRVCSCSIVTNSRLLFILACYSQQPPHIRCEIGGGEKRGEAEGVVTASKHSSFSRTNLCIRSSLHLITPHQPVIVPPLAVVTLGSRSLAPCFLIRYFSVH